MQVLIFLTAFFSFVAQAATIKPNDLVSSKAFQKHTKYDNSDERFAREIIDLNNSLRRHQTNTRAINNLVNNIKSEAFSDFNPLLKEIQRTFTTKLTMSNVLAHCQLDEIHIDNVIGRQLKSNFQSYCHREYLETIKGNSLNDSHISHIVKNIDQFLSPRHQSQFVDVIKSFDSDSKNLIQISEIATDYIINNSLNPDHEIISAISINGRMTSFLQESGFISTEVNKFFIDQFNTMVVEARDLAQASETKKAVELFDRTIKFFSQNISYIPSRHAQRNFLFLGQDFVRDEKFEYAKYVFATSMNHFYESQREDFVFNLLWADIIHDNYTAAEQNLYRLEILSNLTQYSSRTQYWSGKILENRSKEKQATDIYKSIIENSPMSYYAILATKDLSRINPNKPEIKRFIASSISSPSHYLNIESSDYSKHFFDTLKRISIWSDLEMGHWAHSEAISLIDGPTSKIITNEKLLIGTPREIIQRQVIKDLATVFNQKGEFLQTFRLKNRAIGNGTFSIADADLSQLFPLSYLQEIKSKDNSIDPLIILSLIRQESAFNPKAISSAGARGLMQLMPSTARMLQSRIRASQLEDTDTNLTLGIQYFKRRLEQYDGNLVYALAAYNAGEHRVARWQRDLFKHQDPLKVIETIPFAETRNYVKLIYRNLFFYRLLQEDVNLAQSISDSFTVSLN